MPNVQEMSEDIKKKIATMPFAVLVATIKNSMIDAKTAMVELNFDGDDFITTLRIKKIMTKDSN